jgi:hypothetical protein
MVSTSKSNLAYNPRSQALTSRSLTLLETQSLAGYLSFCAKVVRLGRTCMGNIWNFLASFPTSATRTCRRSMPNGVRTDLSWWSTLLPQFNGKHLFDNSSRPIFHLYTDASSIGLGGFYFPAISLQANWEDQTATLDSSSAYAIRIPRGKRHQHINTHERAVLQSFKRWQPIWRRGMVVIRTDNTATLSGLNKRVNSRSIHGATASAPLTSRRSGHQVTRGLASLKRHWIC